MNGKDIATGIGIGLAAGGAAAMLSGTKMNKRALKKKADKAMKTAQGIMGDMRYMFK